MNENLPLYAFANTYSTLDVSLNDLRLQISFLNMRWVLLKILLIRSSRPLTNISTLFCLR
ncbi:hypothetical protein ACVXHB_00030 [Escherichia coli]